MPYTSLTTTTQAGELKLEASQHSDLPGLTNTTNTELRISLSAKGQWCLYNGTIPEYAVFNATTDWKGMVQLAPNIYANHQWRKAGAPAGCVLAEILDANGFIKDIYAAPATLDLPPGHKVVFVINDDVNWYADNSGQISLSYSCSPKNAAGLPAMSFFPEGTKWSACTMDHNGNVKSDYHPTPWEFQNQNVFAGTLWKQSYSAIAGSDNRVAVGGPKGWEVVFVTENRLIAIENGSLFRFAKRINPGSGSKPRPADTSSEKSFNPAGTKWSVAPMNDDGTLGSFDSIPWEFQNQSLNAGTLGSGSYSPIAGSDNRIACKGSHSFEVVFVTADRFVVVKDGSLYRFGKKV